MLLPSNNTSGTPPSQHRNMVPAPQEEVEGVQKEVIFLLHMCCKVMDVMPDLLMMWVFDNSTELSQQSENELS